MRTRRAEGVAGRGRLQIYHGVQRKFAIPSAGQALKRGQGAAFFLYLDKVSMIGYNERDEKYAKEHAVVIEFYGDYSKEAENFALRQNAKQNVVCVSLVALLLTVILLLIAFLCDFWLIMFFEIALVAVIGITWFAPYLERKKHLRLLLPEKVTIDRDGTIFATWQDISVAEPKDNVKKIICKGDCCYIVFRRARARGCLLQKSLLQVGSVEDFERLFAERIVRKF